MNVIVAAKTADFQRLLHSIWIEPGIEDVRAVRQFNQFIRFFSLRFRFRLNHGYIWRAGAREKICFDKVAGARRQFDVKAPDKISIRGGRRAQIGDGLIVHFQKVDDWTIKRQIRNLETVDVRIKSRDRRPAGKTLQIQPNRISPGLQRNMRPIST